MGLIRRWFKFLYQRLIRGYDDSEIWSLDFTIIEFVLPRLKHYREIIINIRLDKEFISDVDELIECLEKLF